MTFAERIRDFFQRHFTPAATIEELDAEHHARRRVSRFADDLADARTMKKTKRGAIHKHRPAGQGRRNHFAR